MLETIGVPDVEALFKAIPVGARRAAPMSLPGPMAEMEVFKAVGELATRNVHAGEFPSFIGAGCYEHYQPAAVDQLLLRQEFYTAYTPYQPEASQGTLTAVFEFQTMVAMLMGLDIANASMYDGPSSAAEAVLMSKRILKKKNRAFLTGAIHPEYEAVIRTYAEPAGIELHRVPADPKSGRIDLKALEGALGEEEANNLCVVVQSPNVYGVLDDLPSAAKLKGDALLIAIVPETVSLGLSAPPGSLGADIAVGEGQPLGLPLSFGGPTLGLFAAREKLMRSLPGRLVGQTVDQKDRRGYVLTLATRAQHLRRERATSNICTNQALCALGASVFLALYGREGFIKLARQNFSKTEYLKGKVGKVPGCSLPFSGPTFNEFVLRLPDSAESTLKRLRESGIAGGVPLDRLLGKEADERDLLVCVTEVRTKKEMDAYAEALTG